MRSASKTGLSEVEEKPLTLSTIHSAKGLEWEVVLLVGVRDGVLPTFRVGGDEEEIQEEQRLLYVAVTHAKARLYLTMHHHGNNQFLNGIFKVSRFLEPHNVQAALQRREVPAGPGSGDTAGPGVGTESHDEGAGNRAPSEVPAWPARGH